MLEKIVKFLVGLLPKVKRLIPIPHSSVVELDCENVENFIVQYIEKHGASELIMLITSMFLCGAVLLLLVFFVFLFFVI